jgi:hypothetical protein
MIKLLTNFIRSHTFGYDSDIRTWAEIEYKKDADRAFFQLKKGIDPNTGRKMK